MKYQDNQIADAVKFSNSWSQVYRLLTNAPEGKSSPGMQNLFKQRAIRVGVDFSHFKFKRKPKIAEVAVMPAAA